MMSGEMRNALFPAGEQRMRRPVRLIGVTMLTAAAGVFVMATVMFAQNLDFQTYRTRVEPIFLKKRPGHARCVVCHEANNSAFRLQAMPPVGGTWTEEQSRKNYENVTHLVKPGDPLASKLLIHPLAPDAGGDQFHGGGWQFVSQKDPDWTAIADWVKAAK
jgi:hypothetical protein